MSKISFSLDKLTSIIQTAKAKSSDGGGSKDFTKTAYLPEGTHKMRFFLDPEENLFRDLKMYQFKGKKTLSPFILNRENEKNPNWPATVQAMKPEWAEQKVTKIPLEDTISAAAKEINSWKSGLDLKTRVMIYAKVYATNKESDFWKPDQVYAIVGKKKLKDAVTAMLESLAADSPDYILAMLNPQMAGGMVTVTVTSGNQGTITITPIPGASKEPIVQLDDGRGPDWWRPLEKVFIQKDFNPKDWEEAEKVAQEVLMEHRKKKAEGTLPSESGSSEGGSEEGGDNDGESERRSESVASSSSNSSESNNETPSVKEESKPVEEPETPAKNLANNQRETKMGRVVDLPDFAVEAQCWTQYNPANTKCITCPVNLECMTERV